MELHPKVDSAMKAMEALGFHWDTTRPVLKDLLEVYEKNWEHIESENYRVLADAVIDSLEEGGSKKKKNYHEAGVNKKYNMHLSDAPIGQPVIRGAQSLISKKSGQIVSTKPSSTYGLNSPGLFQENCGSGKIQILPRVKDSVGGSVSTSSFITDGKDKLALHKVLDTSVRHEEPKNENKRKASATVGNRLAGYKTSQCGEPISSTCSVGGNDSANSLMTGGKVKLTVSKVLDTSFCCEEPKNKNNRKLSATVDKLPEFKASQSREPMSITCSVGGNDSTSPFITDGKDKLSVHKVLDTSICCEEPKNENKRKLQATVFNGLDGYKASQLGISTSSTTRGKEGSCHDHGKNASSNIDKSIQNSSSINIELASSTSGEVRIMVLYDPAPLCSNFQMPSMEFLCKMVEDRCLKSCKILMPHFSVLSLLKEMCHCIVELCSKTAEENRNIDMVRGMNPLFPNGRPDYMSLITYHNNHKQTGWDTDVTRSSGAVANDSVSLSHHSSINTKIVAIGDTDICRGEENVKISLANVPNAERYPPSFHYIPRNIVYQNAYVNISLARIGDEDCCSSCSGDCLTASISCPCARETGGVYAYTSGGLMKREFLETIISMKSNQVKPHLYFCKDCPIERIKNEFMPEPCKGHWIRKFVKECWNKCGCNKICGNRLVQRGITRKLQVFWTAERKGWGLRALEELPIGAFICEYVGEILTNTELYDRQLNVTGKMRHTYPVLLDADWGSEQNLKDEEALCLDATSYGNVARFINHRCVDANVVDVPVEIETPDHHYYHLAFFTVRKVEALEELTWDYGIDFDDHTHPIKAFSCCCGSKYCRDRRQFRKKHALVLR